MKITLKDVYFSVLDEQGELKGAVVKLNEAVEHEYKQMDEKEGELKLDSFFNPLLISSNEFPGVEQVVSTYVEHIEKEWKEQMEGVGRVAAKRVGVVRPKLSSADVWYQAVYGECDFEGINSAVLDKYFKVVRVPGWVYYKMNKGMK